MADVWSQLVAPRCSGQPGYVVAVGADHYQAVLTLDDLLGPEVLVATSINAEPLDIRHGAPLRLVSAPQYGYKSVKHLCGHCCIKRSRGRGAGGFPVQDQIRHRSRPMPRSRGDT